MTRWVVFGGDVAALKAGGRIDFNDLLGVTAELSVSAFNRPVVHPSHGLASTQVMTQQTSRIPQSKHMIHSHSLILALTYSFIPSRLERLIKYLFASKQAHFNLRIVQLSHTKAHMSQLRLGRI